MSDYADAYLARRTGPRSEPPAVCHHCGGDVEETPRFGAEAVCDDCCRKGHRPEPDARLRAMGIRCSER